jgi:hypothetical protein
MDSRTVKYVPHARPVAAREVTCHSTVEGATVSYPKDTPEHVRPLHQSPGAFVTSTDRSRGLTASS